MLCWGTEGLFFFVIVGRIVKLNVSDSFFVFVSLSFAFLALFLTWEEQTWLERRSGKWPLGSWSRLTLKIGSFTKELFWVGFGTIVDGW